MKHSQLRQLIREQIEAEFGPKNEILGLGKSKREEPRPGYYPADSTEDAVKILDDQLEKLKNPKNDLFYLTKGNKSKVDTYVTSNNITQMIKLNIDKAIRAERAIIGANPYEDDGMYEIALGLLLMRNNMKGLGESGIRATLGDLGLSDLRPGIRNIYLTYGGERGDLERLEDLARERLRDAKGGRLRLAKTKDPDEENPLLPLRIKLDVGGPLTGIDVAGETYYTDKARYDRSVNDNKEDILAEFPEMGDTNYKYSVESIAKMKAASLDVPVKSKMEKELDQDIDRAVNGLFVSFARGEGIKDLKDLQARFNKARLYPDLFKLQRDDRL